MVAQTEADAGVTAVGAFLFFGATMALLAGTTLVRRGTILDRAWVVNAAAYARLAHLGQAIGFPFCYSAQF
jgi:hypothetical protein